MSPTSIFRRVLCPAVVLVVVLTVAGTHGSRARADIDFQYSFTADSDTAVLDSSGQRLTEAITVYRDYQSEKTAANWQATRDAVAAFNAYRLKILNYDEEHESRWFPGHRHFANWLTGDTQHESKVYYTWWRDRKDKALERGVEGVAIGYGGGLVEIVNGYNFVRDPLTLDFDNEPK